MLGLPELSLLAQQVQAILNIPDEYPQTGEYTCGDAVLVAENPGKDVLAGGPGIPQTYQIARS